MDTIFTAIGDVSVFVGTLIATMTGLPLETGAILANYLIGFFTLFVIPALFVSWLWQIVDTRPSRLLEDVRLHEKAAQRARNMVKQHVRNMARLFEIDFEARTGERHYFAYFVPLANGKDVELVFHTNKESEAVRATVPIKLFDKDESEQFNHVLSVSREMLDGAHA